MNIQITAYGLGSVHDEAGGGSYDDTDLRKQIAAVVEQVREIADTRKEYQAAYVFRNVFWDDLNPTESVTIKFKKPFSKVPFVKATPNLKTRSAEAVYIANVTETGFDIAAKNVAVLGQLIGVWYEAHLID